MQMRTSTVPNSIAILFLMTLCKFGMGLKSELNSLVSFLFGANADRLFDCGNEDFAIANFSCLSRFHDGCHGGVNLAIGKDQFDFDFGKEIHGVLAAPVNLGVTFLTTEPFD